CFLHELGKARFVDGRQAEVDGFHLLRIDVDRLDSEARGSETSHHRRSEFADTDNRDGIHQGLLKEFVFYIIISGRWAAGGERSEKSENENGGRRTPGSDTGATAKSSLEDTRSSLGGTFVYTNFRSVDNGMIATGRTY